MARGVEDYMAEHGEARGWWAGGGAAAAGLTGEVAEGALSELFGHGRHPVTGEVLGTPLREGSRSGFSLSMSAPKSVSVLWALASEEISDHVGASHDAAVEATIGFLDTHAAFSRRGRGGAMQVDTEGLVAAVYRHRTSRALQPQLHSHVLVANRVRCADGRWRALDGRELFAVQTAAGNVYRAALRAELTSRLGVVWAPVDELGQADVAGVPPELLAAFSGSLAAAATAFTEAGHPVRGLTVSAAAARVLTEQAGIPADTIARHLHTGARPATGEVVVVDEAGMVSTPDLARLVGQAVQAGAKVVLVGDPRQLGPVGPGGLFRLLTHDTHAAELDTIRRFSQLWEADASLRLRDRDPAVLGVYEEHGRIAAGSQVELTEAAFELWAHARSQGEKVIVLAGDHDTVDLLATRARAHLVATGLVESDGQPAVRGQTVGGRRHRHPPQQPPTRGHQRSVGGQRRLLACDRSTR